VEIAAKPLAKDQLGVALVGAGNLARWAHMPNLKQYRHASLRAVYSASGVRGKSVGVRFGAARCTTEYDAILQDPEIGVVIIVSRNQYHAAQALAALRAGKHVFVEKPMALDEDECRALYQAVQETGKQLTVGFNRRFAPLYVPLKEHLARRGSPAVINCRINSPGISGSYWMADPAIGGAILGEACHFVDLMYWMLDAEPVSVSAYSLPTGKKEPIGENNLVASFRFEDGSIGNLTYCTVGSKTSAGERVEVFVEGLGITSENFKRLSVQGAIRRSRRLLFAEKGYRAQLHGFLDGIRQDRPPAVTVRDGVRATLGCLRMLESAKDGMPREIGLDAFLN
jgi:predicted dehydrogenase